MSDTVNASKSNQYAVIGATTAQASKAVQYAVIGVATAQASKANQYVVLTLGWPLGTLRRQRERSWPFGFRNYPRMPWQLDWRLGR